MGSGEVAIVALSTMISLKVTFSDGLGGEAMGGNHAGGPISAHPSERQMPQPMVGKGGAMA